MTASASHRPTPDHLTEILRDTFIALGLSTICREDHYNHTGTTRG